MLQAYTNLHRLGVAHSIEVWQRSRLVGGLYGVALGKVFFGESMFSHASDASKFALVHLAGQLQAWGYELIDCQVTNDHLLSLGAIEIPRTEFEERLRGAVDATGQVSLWAISWEYDAKN
jgi:leucyl/phenylalanyl-tRNA--protein transferase